MKSFMYYLVVAGLTLATIYCFNFLPQQPVNHGQSGKLVLGEISAFLNVFVLAYHFSHPPHPKFFISRQRQLLLYIHIGSGCLELASCLLAYFTEHAGWAMLAAGVALAGHIPTSYSQTPIVSGSKAVMVSSYVFVTTLHLFCALHLLQEPHSASWLLSLFLVLNTYVWVRVFYFLFGRIGLFTESLYTTSVLFAVLLILPSVLGAMGNVLFIGYLIATVSSYYLLMRPNRQKRSQLVVENARPWLVAKVRKELNEHS
ncbi:hypothetical protein [Spirosoma gilvum]